MRLLHTADWHLGRVFHRVDLLDDQRAALEQLVAIVERVEPDALLVAGDIYDRSVPPAGAVKLLDETLGRLVVDLEVPTVLIAGNHDSVERLAFGARLLSQQRLHVYGPLTGEIDPVLLEDEHGPVRIYALPYPEPAVVRDRLGDERVTDHDSAMRALLSHVRGQHPDGERAVVVTHAHVEGGALSESERPLRIGRSQTVRPDCFAGFSYVALGHLHHPQQVGDPRLQYAGSLLPYSFSEAGDAKSVTLVELDARGVPSLQRIPLELRRGVRRIEGTMQQLLERAAKDPRRDDYLRVTLLDEGPVLETTSRLREVYPNVLEVDRPFVTAPAAAGPAAEGASERSVLDEFAAFFEQVTGEELEEELAGELGAVVEALPGRGAPLERPDAAGSDRGGAARGDDERDDTESTGEEVRPA